MDLDTANKAAAIATQINGLTQIETAFTTAIQSGAVFREATMDTGPTVVVAGLLTADSMKSIAKAVLTAIASDIETLTAQLATM